jgi:hypothetical protein
MNSRPGQWRRLAIIAHLVLPVTTRLAPVPDGDDRRVGEARVADDRKVIGACRDADCGRVAAHLVADHEAELIANERADGFRADYERERDRGDRSMAMHDALAAELGGLRKAMEVHADATRNPGGGHPVVTEPPRHWAIRVAPMAEGSGRFPPPWRADKMPGGYVVRDANGQALAYVYSRRPKRRRCRRRC